MSILQKTVKSGQGATDIPVITCQDLKAKYGFSFPETKTTYYDNMILAAQQACADYMGMDTLRQLIDCTEYIDTNIGQKSIILTGTPLYSVTSITDGDTTVTDYLCNTDSQVVRLMDGAKTTMVKVCYVIGWGSDIPADIKYCVAMTVQNMARMANASLVGKNSMSTDGGSETYEQSVVPNMIRVYLDRRRLNRMG